MPHIYKKEVMTLSKLRVIFSLETCEVFIVRFDIAKANEMTRANDELPEVDIMEV